MTKRWQERQRAGGAAEIQHAVDEPRREAEPEPHVQGIHHDESDSGEQCVHGVGRRREKHEGEFDGLGDAGEDRVSGPRIAGKAIALSVRLQNPLDTVPRAVPHLVGPVKFQHSTTHQKIPL